MLPATLQPQSIDFSPQLHGFVTQSALLRKDRPQLFVTILDETIYFETFCFNFIFSFCFFLGWGWSHFFFFFNIWLLDHFILLKQFWGSIPGSHFSVDGASIYGDFAVNGRNIPSKGYWVSTFLDRGWDSDGFEAGSKWHSVSNGFFHFIYWGVRLHLIDHLKGSFKAGIYWTKLKRKLCDGGV